MFYSEYDISYKSLVHEIGSLNAEIKRLKNIIELKNIDLDKSELLLSIEDLRKQNNFLVDEIKNTKKELKNTKKKFNDTSEIDKLEWNLMRAECHIALLNSDIDLLNSNYLSVKKMASTFYESEYNIKKVNKKLRHQNNRLIEEQKNYIDKINKFEDILAALDGNESSPPYKTHITLRIRNKWLNTERKRLLSLLKIKSDGSGN